MRRPKKEKRMAIDVRGLAPLIQVFDMPASIRFYRDALGFELVQTSPELSANPDDVNWCMFRLQNGAELMLNTAYEPETRPAAPDRVRFGGHSDCCIYFGCPNVDQAYQHLRAQGIDVYPPKVAPYGMKQLYLTDPDGYNLCFQWPAKAD
jgi:glyoxylase I family protein